MRDDILGIINPFRYRSHIIDSESALYYVYHRYVNPSNGRFINADSKSSEIFGITANNPYSYCRNTPIITTDDDGEDLVIITASSGAAYFGHTSLLIQDEAQNWHYYYYGPKGDVSIFHIIFSTVEATVIYEDVNFTEISPDSDDFYSELNTQVAFLHGNARVKKQNYDRAIYVEGDFTKSNEAAKGQAENSQNERYNLFKNNCVLNSIDLIDSSLPGFADSLNKYRIDFEVETNNVSILNWRIPNFMHSMMEGYFSNNS